MTSVAPVVFVIVKVVAVVGTACTGLARVVTSLAMQKKVLLLVYPGEIVITAEFEARVAFPK